MHKISIREEPSTSKSFRAVLHNDFIAPLQLRVQYHKVHHRQLNRESYDQNYNNNLNLAEILVIFFFFCFKILHWHHRSFVECKLNVSCLCQHNQPVQTDLHKCNAKSLSSLSLFQSHSDLTAGTALITVHHTPHCLSSSPRFLTNACIYLSHLPQSIIPEKAQSPG